MQNLAERVAGRDNNFDLIRWMAASLVIISHEWAIVRTPGDEFLVVQSGGFAFGLGALAYTLREWIPFTVALPAAAWMSLAFVVKTEAFVPTFAIAVTLTVLWLAYARLGRLAHWGRHGDFSYGLYIYAFPIQQAFAAGFPAWGRPTHFLAAYAATLLCAVLSWKFDEAPAMQLKKRLLPSLRGA